MTVDREVTQESQRPAGAVIAEPSAPVNTFGGGATGWARRSVIEIHCELPLIRA